MKYTLASGLVLLVTACASAPEPAFTGAPSITMPPGVTAPPQARQYADCIAQAAETGAYQREQDSKTLRFTCTGDAARTFYDVLGPWSAKIGAEYMADGRTWRFSQKLIRDGHGIDNCSTGGAGEFRCNVILAVGDFIAQSD